MPHEIAGITTCTLSNAEGKPCGQKFAGPMHLVIGPNAPSRMAALLEKLVQHLAKAHPENFKAMLLEAQQYQGLLFMMAFQSTDTEFREQQNYYRWCVHQQTLNARLSDEKLRLAAAAVTEAAIHDWRADVDLKEDLKMHVSRRIEIALRDLRDALQEPLEPPNPAAPAVAVTH
jgi:hypothetical protein